MKIKCIKDTEGYWTEGEMYPARVVAGGFVQVGDDDDPNGEGWSAAPMEYREDGSIVFRSVGLRVMCCSRRPAMTDITELTSVQKNANIHRLSRLIAYASNDELRQMAVEVEHYTDQLIEALEKAQETIAFQQGEIKALLSSLESRTVKLPAERFCPAEYAGSQLWSETEVWNKAITACADALRAAGIKVEAE